MLRGDEHDSEAKEEKIGREMLKSQRRRNKIGEFKSKQEKFEGVSRSRKGLNGAFIPSTSSVFSAEIV